MKRQDEIVKTLCYASRHNSTYTLYKMSATPPKSKAFAHNLKLARKAAGLTQEQLIKKTGLRQASISDIENGKRTPSLANAIILAEAVNTPLCELLKDRPQEN